MAAALLAGQGPGAWQRLRADHVADSGGHCRACSGPSWAAPVWPCRLAVIAAEAARQSEGDGRRRGGGTG